MLNIIQLGMLMKRKLYWCHSQAKDGSGSNAVMYDK